MNSPILWAQAHPLPAALAVALALAAAVLLARAGRKAAGRAPAAVVVASLAAMACTAYSADTSWRFAADYLGMASTGERAAMFGAAELALFACALMARQNLRTQGAPGTPGLLVWGITGVQVIPAYSESGVVGGTVRAVVGPVLAALLWHLAMGIELRHAKPGTDSASLPALLARELRERLLSYLGLATRDRTAEQITRDRWTVKAVGLAAKLADMEPGARGRARVARRLSVAVGKAQAGASEEQRTKLLDLLAARRHAASLATIDLASPWQDTPQAAEDAPASAPVQHDYPFPVVAPPGVRLLPIVARPVPVEAIRRQYRLDHFAERYVPVEKDDPKYPRDPHAPRWTVSQAVASPPAFTPIWDVHKAVDLPKKMTTAVPAETTRQMVTETIIRTPSDLRREARRLNREAVKSSNRPVTIKTLQDVLGLSRREATDLRREVVGGERS
ncbi:membrane protein [Streptomyces hygroscopicus subsp. jinggangensis 5008]|nr:membrane protein [Streptomyces hygroscopicus subsp. jinggangensis 5008]AGF64928.1 membrane protein [Streptomyces hygroscopicus subsp. jinggangensis TL01]